MTSRPVLCAVDISNPNLDNDVLKMAKKLADLDDAQLDVITVVPDFGMSVVGSVFEEEEQVRRPSTWAIHLISGGSSMLIEKKGDCFCLLK